MIASNAAGEVSTKMRIVVLGRPEPVEKLEIVEINADFATLNWNMPKDTGGADISGYTVEKRDNDSCNWNLVSNSISRTNCRISSLVAGLEYNFRVMAENRVGLSSPVVTETALAKYPFAVPSAPQDVVISEIHKESMTIDFNPPRKSGGSRVTHYICEFRENNSQFWKEGCETRSTEGRINGLIEGLEYQFRVRACNIAGPSEPSDPTWCAKALDPCDAPYDLKVDDITASTVSLSWVAPKYTGGHRLAGYDIEFRKHPGKIWQKANFTGVQSVFYTVTDLIDGCCYDFRVIARNTAGCSSKPCPAVVEIDVKDVYIPATIEFDQTLLEGCTVRAGQDILITAKIAGKPIPRVNWMHGNADIRENDFVKITNGPMTSELLIKDSKLKHSGDYNCTVSNHYGTASLSCHIAVLDRPGAVDQVQVYGVTEERVRLQWSPPKQSGGSEIQRYIVEKRETSRLIWTTVDDDCRQCNCTIKRLIKDNQYIFRVSPANKYGAGTPKESEAVVIKNEFTVARAPGKPKIASTMSDSITITWDRPTHDGGSQITGYHVERRNKKNMNWVRAHKSAVHECRLRVAHLQAGNEYEFRVSAINKAGIGAVSEASEYGMAQDPLYAPSKPGSPKIVDSNKNSVHLRWAKPIHDGGAPIKNYIVEMAVQDPTADEINYQSITALPIPDTEYKINGLDQKMVAFRVIACNDVGASEASQDSGWVSADEIIEPPIYELDVECQRTMMVKAGATFRISMKMKGRPEPSITWRKAEGDMNELAVIDTQKGRSTLIIERATVLDSGRYEFVLESAAGTKDGAVSVRVIDAPSAPLNVCVTDIGKDEVKLTWDTPASDGCAPITHYIVEKKTADKKSWTTVTDNCEREMCQVKSLITGLSYFFRVRGVNKYGEGKEGVTAEPSIIASKPDQPMSIEVVEMTKSSGQIAWTKPLSDGGSAVTGYVVEMALSVVGAETWIEQGSTNKNSYECTGLKEGAGYVFRVMAKNAIGLSEPIETRLTEIAKDHIIAPDLDMRELYMSSYTCRAGENVDLRIPVIGKPAPVTRWNNVDDTWRETQRANTEMFTDNGTLFTRLQIADTVRSDADEFILTTKSSAGEKQTKLRFVVLDRPSVPVGPIEFTDVNTTSATLTWSAPKEDGGAQIGSYIVQCRESDSDQWVEVAGTVVRACYKAKNLRAGSEYKFRVFAENRFGRSDPLVSQNIKAEWPFRAPSAPSAPTAVEASRNWIKVKWNEPINNGGDKITGYYLEKKERSALVWTAAVRGALKGLQAQVSNLADGASYEFRVCAENRAGKSKVSQASEAVMCKDQCERCGKPELLELGRTSALIAWQKPAYDGGAKITGYTIEKEEEGNKGRWLKCNFSNVLETRFNITGLEENTAYIFRVQAKNAANTLSEWSETSDEIIPKDEIVSPKVLIDAKYKDVVMAKSSDSLKFMVHIQGTPLPIVKWTKDGKDLVETKNVRIRNDERESWVEIKEASRLDTGTYGVSARNIGGIDNGEIRTRVLSRPGPCDKLTVKVMNKTTMRLSWDQPTDNGGADVSSYTIEKRETSHLAWTLVGSDITSTSYKCANLFEGNEYIFRVAGVNKYGKGEIIESKAAKAKNPYDPASKPGSPEASNVVDGSLTLTWTRPVETGGAEIENYVVEKRDKDGMRWVRAVKKRVSECRTRIAGLAMDRTFEFRVIAENAAGQSEPSDPSSYVHMVNPIYPPSGPTNIRVETSTNTSVTLGWNKPNFDGGSDIIGYAVEYAVEPAEGVEAEYQKIIIRNTNLHYTIPGLSELNHYLFRVIAFNNTVESEAVALFDPYKPQIIMIAPEIDLDCSIKQALKVKAGVPLRINGKVSGNPAPSVSWKKDNMPLPDRVFVESGLGSTRLEIEKPNRNDSGAYAVTISSSAGSKEVTVNVVIQDTPSAPVDICIKEKSTDFVTLQWNAPVNDGGSIVSNYIIEMKESTKKAWKTAAENVTRQNYRVDGLVRGLVYFFRVKAVNEFGEGPACALDESFRASGPPGPVGRINVTDVGDGYVAVEWNKPEDDGGAKINSYKVEYKQIVRDTIKV